MKLFFDPFNAESRVQIKASIEKLRNFGLDRFLDRMMPYIHERLRIWDKIVKEDFPDEVFSARTMLRQGNLAGDRGYLIEPVILNAGIEDIVHELGLVIKTPPHTYNKDFRYIFLQTDAKVNFAGKQTCSALIGGVIISDKVYQELKDSGLADRVCDILQWTVLDFGHDFIHTATDIKKPGSFIVKSEKDVASKVWDLTWALHDDDRNTRSARGYEEFALQLNQQIFLWARGENNVWYKTLLYRTEKIAEIIAEVQKKCSPELTKNFIEMMAFFVSNYVPRELLLKSDPSNWIEILQMAQPAIANPKFWLGEGLYTPAELSLKYQAAFIHDIANGRLGFVEAQL